MKAYAFKTMNDLILRSNEKHKIKLKLSSMLSNQVAISFNNIEQFPKSKGIYLLYIGDNFTNPIYIGCAKGKKRTIQIRCNQYLINGNGGDNFRGKIKAFLGVDSELAITYIKNNVSAKFVVMGDADPSEILWKESLYIWSYNSILNTITKPKTLII